MRQYLCRLEGDSPLAATFMALSNVNYDILSVLQNKLDALAVYDEYIEDAREAGDTQCQQLFEQIRQQDEQHAELLRSEIERLVREDKFH